MTQRELAAVKCTSTQSRTQLVHFVILSYNALTSKKAPLSLTTRCFSMNSAVNRRLCSVYSQCQAVRAEMTFNGHWSCIDSLDMISYLLGYQIIGSSESLCLT